MEGFLTAEQLAARLGVQRASIYRMHTRGDLPKPEKVGRTPLWPVAVIETWENSRPGHGWRKGKRGTCADEHQPPHERDSRPEMCATCSAQDAPE